MAKDLGILYFGRDSNNKLKGQPVATFSLPAGYTCPGAHGCFAKFDRIKRKVVDGPHQRFRCFAASMEAARPSVRVSVDRNFALLRAAGKVDRMAAIITKSLPPSYYDKIRIHVDGDYYSMDYMLAWIETANRNPDRTFYGYTKSLPFWVNLRGMMPANLVLNASWDGKYDHLIESEGLPNAKVYFHPDEAAEDGVEIDHDDSLAINPAVTRFGLLIHGPQRAGSEAAAALKRLRHEKIKYSYSKTH